MHATEDQKKAIQAVATCRETYESEPAALDAAASAVGSALGIDSEKAILVIDELVHFGWIEMRSRSQGDAHRINWKVTDAGRVQLQEKSTGHV